MKVAFVFISSLARFCNCCSMVWARMYSQWIYYCLPFWSLGGGKKLFAQCIFGRDFLSPCTTIVLGIENYPSACMSCCSDDLAMLLPRLAL